MTADERSWLANIETKVDILLDRSTRWEKDLDDHEERLRSVERWKLSIPISMLLVAATVVGAVISGR